MKNYYCLSVLFAFLFSVHVYADQNQVEVEGKWGDERVRSSVPEHLVAYINNNVLSIYLVDALENLTIIIIDSNGSIVYQDCISSNGSGYVHTIDLKSGCYTIMITHHLGYLNGSFNINKYQ
jgi:hypothetical protein